jgi:hypothetical protein
MASLLRGLSGAGQQTKRVRVPQTLIADYLEENRVKTLLRSVSVLDKWLKDNDGKLEDEVRVQRIEHWRKEALEQLKSKLNLSRH